MVKHYYLDITDKQSIFAMRTLFEYLKPKKKMKYNIEVYVRGLGVQLLKVNEKEKDILLKKEGLDSVFTEWAEKKDYDFEYENQFLSDSRFGFIVEDEEGNTVFESNNVSILTDNDRTIIDDDNETYINGYEFIGIKDGYYLVRKQIIKGCHYQCEIELDGEFDVQRLYVVRDDRVNDELMGEEVYPITHICYMRGNTPNFIDDNLNMEFESDYGEQYFDTYLYSVSNKDWWEQL